MSRRGLLLINLGSPESPDPSDVRRYLRQFLSDPRVIDINPIGRWLLLNLIILPFRPKQAGEAYAKIWQPDGSPLLIHTFALRDRLREALGDAWRISAGMRYGTPSIQSALEEILAHSIDHLIVVPLFPQFAEASNGSAIAELERVLHQVKQAPTVDIVRSFFDTPGFIDALAATHREVLDRFDAEHVLFSYHGIPERHLLPFETADVGCDRIEPCPAVGDNNRECYRAHCYATSRALIAAAGLDPEICSTSFQSRLGRTPWIRPYTDHVLPALAARGIKRLAISSPSFTADCLETIEEIGMRYRELWLESGGREFELIPCVNSHPTWVEGLATMVRERAQLDT